MTDDELTAIAAEVFKHFDRREAATERTIRLREWALSLFCWDGILPFTVIAISVALKLLVPKLEILHIFAIVVVPIAAFFVRLAIGNKHFQRVQHYGWQMVLFALAIFFLVSVDAFFIIIQVFPQQLEAGDWLTLGGLYLVYLLVVGVALFPLRSAVTSDGRQLEFIDEG
jgi:hypothetical protein